MHYNSPETPKVSVIFLGYAHHDLNISDINLFHEILDQRMQKQGRIIVFLENAEGPSNFWQRLKKTADKYSFTGVLGLDILPKQLGKQQIFDFELNRWIQQVSSGDLPAILRLVPTEHVQDLFLFQALDQAKGKKSDFSVAGESHSPSSLKKIQALQEEYQQLSIQSRIMWHRGEFNKSLTTYKRSIIAIHKNSDLRERDIVSAVNGLSRSILYMRD